MTLDQDTNNKILKEIMLQSNPKLSYLIMKYKLFTTEIEVPCISGDLEIRETKHFAVLLSNTVKLVYKELSYQN